MPFANRPLGLLQVVRPARAPRDARASARRRIAGLALVALAVVMSRYGRPVRATRGLEQEPERVYRFLADLSNHWLLSRQLVSLDSLDPDGAGGRVRVRGP